jgi:hypothetical protein
VHVVQDASLGPQTGDRLPPMMFKIAEGPWRVELLSTRVPDTGTDPWFQTASTELNTRDFFH